MNHPDPPLTAGNNPPQRGSRVATDVHRNNRLHGLRFEDHRPEAEVFARDAA